MKFRLGDPGELALGFMGFDALGRLALCQEPPNLLLEQFQTLGRE